MSTWEYAIFDFDGTISNLRVDWDKIREKFSLRKVSDFWFMENYKKQEVMEYISQREIDGIECRLNFEKSALSLFREFGVLSNNSEKCIGIFFSNEIWQLTGGINVPKVVVGRESLKGSKEDRKIFEKGINMILSNWTDTNVNKCLYVGDQNYEIAYAQELGLSSLSISAFRFQVQAKSLSDN